MYVDGYVLPVPIKNLEAYKEIASRAGEIWMSHGALAYVECIAEDVKPGVHTSFPQAVKLEEGRRSSSRGSPTSRGRIATASARP